MVQVASDWLIRSRLKTRQLVLLVHLDDERSVLRAAEAAGMTQPAASKLLRELEEALDVELFERHARGVAPTWYGEILVRHARAVLSEIGRAHEEIAALKAGRAGQVSVGTVMNPGTNLVPMAVAALKRKYPDMLVGIEMDTSKPLVDKLLKGELDMLVARVLDSNGAEQLQIELLADERHAIIAGAHHPLAGRKDLQLEDLVHQGWIMQPQGSLARDRLLAMFMQRGLAVPRNVVHTFSLPVVTSLLRSTDMVVALPEETVRPYCDTGMLTVLMPNVGIEIGSFGIVTRRDQRLSPGAQAMLSALRSTAATLYAKDGG